MRDGERNLDTETHKEKQRGRVGESLKQRDGERDQKRQERGKNASRDTER